jgi:hypothetical protein
VRRGAPWTVEGTEQLPGRCGGYGRAGSVPIAEPSRLPSRKRRPHRGAFGVREAVFVVGAVEDVRMLAVPFAACPRPVSGAGCPVCGRPCPCVPRPRPPVRTGGVRGARRCGGAAPRLDGRLGRGRQPRPRAARSSTRVRMARSELAEAVWVNGGVGREPGRRLRMDAFGPRLQPRSTAWPTRTAGWARGSPVGWLDDHGRGAGCTQPSPTCRMTARMSSGAGLRA